MGNDFHNLKTSSEMASDRLVEDMLVDCFGGRHPAEQKFVIHMVSAHVSVGQGERRYRYHG